MGKKVIIWILTLIGCVLIYLGITNRFAIYTIGETREIIKYDRWFGKAWLIEAAEKTEEDVELDDYDKAKLRQLDSLSTSLNNLNKEVKELQSQAPKKSNEIDSLIEEILTVKTKIYILNPNYLDIERIFGTPEDEKIQTLTKEAEYLEYQLNKLMIEKPRKLQKIDSLTTHVAKRRQQLIQLLKILENE